MEQTVCLLCKLEFLHLVQRGLWSFMQNRVRASWCILQNPSTSTDIRRFLSFSTASHMLCSTMFSGGSGVEDTVLQIGHSRAPRCCQKVCRQILQMLWEQARSKGSLKMSQHTGQEKSSSVREGLESMVSHVETIKHLSLLLKFILWLWGGASVNSCTQVCTWKSRSMQICEVFFGSLLSERLTFFS